MHQKVTNHKRIFPFHTIESMRVRIDWFINLRWLAVIGVLIAVPIGEEMLSFNLPYGNIILLAALLMVLNIIYFFFIRYLPFEREFDELVFVEIQIILDLIIISFLIHYSGGLTNPFFILYLVHVILSGSLFPGWKLPIINAALAALLFTVWTILEYNEVVQHYQLTVEPFTLSTLITALVAFYIINFAGLYIIKNFLIAFRSMKSVIDEKNIQLENAMKERSRVFRYAAHELKSPLAAIQSSISSVKSVFGNNGNEEAIQQIDRAEKRVDQVLNMVKELITISQYNLEFEKLKMEPVNFSEWLQTQVEQQIPLADKKNINIKFIPLDEELRLEIDKNGMEKVVLNLISNALRYTPNEGSITVRAFKSSAHYGFTVKDTGIGIPEDEQEKIFHEFYRSKEAKQMEKIGTGMGLSMVKEIVEKNGGEIFLESEVGKGSTFIVKFPLPAEMQWVSDV